MEVQLKRHWQWLLLLAVLLPAGWMWVEQFWLNQTELSALAVFPFLGIGAWVVMWTHYTGGLLRKRYQLETSQQYSRVSHTLVTALILLHPALLAYSQYESSGVLPPDSFDDYVGQSAKLAIVAGTISLLIFLSFDVYRWLIKSKLWQKFALTVAISQALAMSLIFWHGLRLGQHLDSGWYRYWWIGLGLVLLVGLHADIYRNLERRANQTDSAT